MAELSDVIPLGEWMPDNPDYKNGGCLRAENVLTNGDNYKPFPSLDIISSTLGAKCLGAYSYIAPDGNVTTFAGTATKLYKLSSGAWTDVTRTSGGDYTTTSEGSWKFVQYGTMVIATNYADKMQKFDVGTDTDFSDLITTGPDVRCRNFGIINNFLVCCDVNDDEGATPNRVRWSPINNPSGDWTPSTATQADYQNLEDGNPGAAAAVIGSQNIAAGQAYGVIVCRNAIYRMDYVGPDAIFTFNLLETGRGAIHENAVTSNGVNAVYLDASGIFEFNGSVSVPIGNMKVDKYIANGIDRQYLYNIAMAAEPNRKLIVLSYTSLDTGDGRNDKTVIYNWADKRFTSLDTGYDVLFRLYSSGVTLEELGALFPNLDNVPYSLDSRYWQGGVASLGAFNKSNILGSFTGTPMTAYLETQDVRLNNSGLTYIESASPVFEGGTAEVRLGTKLLTADAVNYTSYRPISSVTGEVDFGIEARFARLTVKMSGDWEQFQGVQLRAAPAGGI